MLDEENSSEDGSCSGSDASSKSTRSSANEYLEDIQFLADMLGVDITEKPTASEVENYKSSKNSWHQRQGQRISEPMRDQSPNSYVQHEALDEIHLVELAAMCHCSISKKFPNLVSPSDHVQKMQSADDRDICKCPGCL